MVTYHELSPRRRHLLSPLSRITKTFFFTCVRLLSKEMSAGLVGLSLTYVRLLAGTFQWCVRQSAEVENMVCYGQMLWLLTF